MVDIWRTDDVFIEHDIDKLNIIEGDPLPENDAIF